MKEDYPDIYEMFSYWGESWFHQTEEGDIEREYKEKGIWD